MEQNKKHRKEPLEYYIYSSTGIIEYDPKRDKAVEPFWGIVKCDPEIIKYYRWFLLRRGIEIQKGSLWGAHITWNRGEKPPHKSFWGKHEGAEVEFRYTNQLRWDNGKHVWLDAYCPPLNRVREELGLEPLPQMSFHLTIGRLVMPKQNFKIMTDYPYKD